MPLFRKHGAALLLSLLFSAALLLALAMPVRAAGRSGTPVQLPIVMYHNFSDQARLQDDFTLSPQVFAADLDWLQTHGYEAISVSQLLDYVYNGTPLPEKPVMLTFDDSYESFLLLAYPQLVQRDMCAVVNVLGWPAQERVGAEDHGLPYSSMNWEQIQSIAGSGLVEFESHTYALHSQADGRSGCQIRPGEDLQSYQSLLYNDLDKLQKYLTIYAGAAPLAFAFPFGATCQEALPVLKDLGFKAAFTCDGHINHLSPGDTAALYALGRFNRPSGPSPEDYFTGVMGLA